MPRGLVLVVPTEAAVRTVGVDGGCLWKGIAGLLNVDGAVGVGHAGLGIGSRPDRVSHGTDPTETEARGLIAGQGGGIVHAHTHGLGEPVSAGDIVLERLVDRDSNRVLPLIDPPNLVSGPNRQCIRDDGVLDDDVLHHAGLRAYLHFRVCFRRRR